MITLPFGGGLFVQIVQSRAHGKMAAWNIYVLCLYNIKVVPE